MGFRELTELGKLMVLDQYQGESRAVEEKPQVVVGAPSKETKLNYTNTSSLIFFFFPLKTRLYLAFLKQSEKLKSNLYQQLTCKKLAALMQPEVCGQCLNVQVEAGDGWCPSRPCPGTGAL